MAFGSSPAAAGPAVTPDCSQMATTPPGAPLVVWCATAVFSETTGSYDDVRLWRSSGDARWVEAKATGVVLNAVPSPPQASPRWVHDRTLYWATSGGLFASTDLGETFALVAAPVTGQQHPIRRVLLTDSGDGVEAAVAGYDPHDVGWVASSAPAPMPALGSPGEDLTFVRTSGGNGVLAWNAGSAPHHVVGYRCDAAYSCTTPWFELPAPTDEWSHQLDGAWTGPDGATYVAVRHGPHYTANGLWRVGSEVTRLSAAEALASRVGGGVAPWVVVAFAGRNVVLRVTSYEDRRGTAHDQIHVSASGGASWKSVTVAATTKAGRASGPPGWRPGIVSLTFVPALAVHGDLWLANVSDGRRVVLQCSRDNGRHWRPTCR